MVSYDPLTNTVHISTDEPYNVFQGGPVGPLPTPTCDWSAFPTLELQAPIVKHCHEHGDDLFVREVVIANQDDKDTENRAYQFEYRSGPLRTMTLLLRMV